MIRLLRLFDGRILVDLDARCAFVGVRVTQHYVRICFLPCVVVSVRRERNW